MLENLPPPPPGKTGWPWNTEDEALPEALRNGAPWPRISIVTPSLNQGAYIEETIRSVLLQGYPNFEYIVIDGGSDDETVGILKKYDGFLSYWVSEPDCGQSHGINKGIAVATGDILAYINSDDFYLPGAFHSVAEEFLKQPDCDLLYGGCRIVEAGGQSIRDHRGSISSIHDLLDLWDVWWKDQYLVQPEVFWTRRVAEKVGPFREDLYIAMDFEYWVRILSAGARVTKLDDVLAAFRLTPEQKTKQSQRTTTELLEIIGPPLWDHSLAIARRRRWATQAKWLYQCVFLTEVRKSEALDEGALKRWSRLLICLLFHPKILTSRGFLCRVKNVVLAKVGGGH